MDGSQRGRDSGARPDVRFEAADRLHSTAIHLLRRLRLQDIASGIGPARLSALSVLVFAGPKSLKELAEIEQVKPPTMSRVVAGLQRSGLVKRHADPNDARRAVLSATARGIKALHDARIRRVQLLADYLAQLSPQELETVAQAERLLRRVLR